MLVLSSVHQRDSSETCDASIATRRWDERPPHDPSGTAPTSVPGALLMTDRAHTLPVERLSVHLQWPTRTPFAQNQTT